MLSNLDLDPKCQGHSRNQMLMTWGTKNRPPQKKLNRGRLNNWCDADADADEDANADSSKSICRPPPYGGVDINILPQSTHPCPMIPTITCIFIWIFFNSSYGTTCIIC